MIELCLFFAEYASCVCFFFELFIVYNIFALTLCLVISVFTPDQLQDITRKLAPELHHENWTVFGFNLRVGPDVLQQLSRVYPDVTQRMHQLLTVWLHTWQGSRDAAMAAIIQALHEVQVHHLAEQFSRIYRPSEEGERTNLIL